MTMTKSGWRTTGAVVAVAALTALGVLAVGIMSAVPAMAH